MARILLVDDSLEWRRSIHRSLPGHVVDLAESYDTAVELLQRGILYDVAIVDLNLVESPEDDSLDLLGGEILTQLRRDFPSTRRIALTGQPPGAVRKEVFDRYDVYDLLLKGKTTLSVVRDMVRLPIEGTPDDVPLAVKVRRSELSETFRGFREDLTRQYNKQLRSIRDGLRDPARGPVRDDAEKAVTALQGELAALEAKQQDFNRQCSDIVTMIDKIRNLEDASKAEHYIEDLKHRFGNADLA